MTDITRVTQGGALLGECPLWDPRARVLWWIDIAARRIHRYDPTFEVDTFTTLPGRPGSIALTGGFHELLVAMENELLWFDWDAGTLEAWIELEPPDMGNRLNDGACDRQGRFWVGSMGDPFEENDHTGRLHRVLPDGSFTTTQRSVGIANGIAFSPAGDTMYFADSERRTVWAYDYDPATGDATGERVFVELGSELPGKPDGATVDEDGCYWLACVYGWSLARITPRGDVDRVVEMPVENPSKPAFGGSDLDVLYVTTIGSGGTEPTVTHQADDGAVFAVDAGVRGLPEPTFAAERPARSGG